MNYKAAVKNKQTGETIVITSNYSSKRAFIADLRANGYAVNASRVYTEACYDYNVANRNADEFISDSEFSRMS